MSESELRRRLHDAMRAGERLRVDVLRMFLAELQRKRTDACAETDAAGFVAVARGLIKRRRDAAEQFAQARRADLAARENAEIAILEEFLPPAPSAADIEKAADDAIAACDARTPRDIGKVMARIKASSPAADMSAAAKVVARKLSGA